MCQAGVSVPFICVQSYVVCVAEDVNVHTLHCMTRQTDEQILILLFSASFCNMQQGVLKAISVKSCARVRVCACARVSVLLMCVCVFVVGAYSTPPDCHRSHCLSHLQGSRSRKLGHRRLPNTRVNRRPHQMSVQQDLHLRRVSAAS